MNIAEELAHFLREDRSREPAVTVIGDLGYDYIYRCAALEQGKEVLIREFTRTLAGAGGYVACGLARLGARVFFLTELGDDPDGRQLLSEVSGRGIETGGIRRLPESRSCFTLIFTEAPESLPRQAATYLGPLGRMSVRSLDYESFAARSDLVYSCNYFQLLTLRSEIQEVFAFSRDRGKLTAYDANAGDGWEDPGRLELLKKRIYPQTSIVFLNETEARFLTGERDPLRALKAASPSSEIVVVKLGARGAVLRQGQRVIRCSAFPPAGEVKDTVGAGDSFQAAFLYFHLKGLPIHHCAILAAAGAAATLQYPGGLRGQQSRLELAAMLERYDVLLSSGQGVEIALKERQA